MLRNRKRDGNASDSPPQPDGGFQALDQMANWVRFAETKATILTAGLGVVTTVLMTNSRSIFTAMMAGCPQALIVGLLAALTIGAFVYTLFWLTTAIGPRNNSASTHLNRFAWPTLVNASAEQLSKHALEVEAREDAWAQVIDLSDLAARKFRACGKAVRGFACLVILAVACISTAIALTL